VVIALIGLIVTLVLPAVQAARESARRAQCLNNLRQIALAAHSYHDAFLCLPVGRVMTWDPRYSGPNPPCTSPIVDRSFLIGLLPYLEQSPAFNSINQATSIFAYENRTAQSFAVSVLVCPSDPGARVRDGESALLAGFGLADPSVPVPTFFTSYSGCYGSYYVNALPTRRFGCSVPPPLSNQADGLIGDRSPISFSSIPDGLSQTMLAAEKATDDFRRLDAFAPASSSRYGWYVAGNWGDTLFTSFFSPNMFGKVAVSQASWPNQAFAASSRHPGGLVIAMADGSSRFIKESIQSWPFDPATGVPAGAELGPGGWWTKVPPPGVWQALATRSGGEAFSGGD